MDIQELKLTLSDLTERLNDIKINVYKIDSKKTRLQEIESQLSQEKVWSNLELSQKLSKEKTALEKTISSYDNVSARLSDCQVLLDVSVEENDDSSFQEIFDETLKLNDLVEDLEKEGFIFVGSTEGLAKYPDIFRPYFGKVIPTTDNKFSALNSATFSGGSFIYVPKGVKLKQPLQAYFRINAENFGQFERTLIIADEGAEITYMEGCTAPKFETATLHSAVVELVALKNAKIQYITVQNWSNNVFNLVTKRGMADEGAEVKWIDCNIGSRLTMKYPGVVLKGKGARGEVLSIALANDRQHQDTGAKMLHLADDTTSNIISKSISIGEGRSTYRGQVHMPKHLKNCRNNTECDALLINSNSRTDTYPAITTRGENNTVQHEASVSKVSAEQIFYMMQRGLSEGEAMSLAVNGFVNELMKAFPMEYSVELKRLIDMEMEGSVG